MRIEVNIQDAEFLVIHALPPLSWEIDSLIGKLSSLPVNPAFVPLHGIAIYFITLKQSPISEQD